MPRKEKSPGPKKKTPKKRDLEDPAMQEADFNQLLQNALEQVNAQHEEKLKELDKKPELTSDSSQKGRVPPSEHRDHPSCRLCRSRCQRASGGVEGGSGSGGRQLTGRY